MGKSIMNGGLAIAMFDDLVGFFHRQEWDGIRQKLFDSDISVVSCFF
jgi:hypothetical protein